MTDQNGRPNKHDHASFHDETWFDWRMRSLMGPSLQMLPAR